jgi:hypothetical protein
VSEYVSDNEITCPEMIYQNDRIVIGATMLIEDLVNIVGYAEVDEAE